MSEIYNAKIIKVSLNMRNHGVLTFDITLEGDGVGVIFGGYCLGNGYLGSDSFKGSQRGIECLMRVMDVIGVEEWEDLKGKYCRFISDGWGESVTKIGNIIKDQWFDIKEFFKQVEL